MRACERRCARCERSHHSAILEARGRDRTHFLLTSCLWVPLESLVSAVVEKNSSIPAYRCTAVPASRCTRGTLFFMMRTPPLARRWFIYFENTEGKIWTSPRHKLQQFSDFRNIALKGYGVCVVSKHRTGTAAFDAPFIEMSFSHHRKEKYAPPKKCRQ